MKIRFLFFVCCLISFSTPLFAAEGGVEMVLAKTTINASDIESIKRGAKFFANTCMVCHTMVYLRNNQLAQEAGITIDKMPINVKTWPYGVTPPDLSNETDVRGVDWIYTYLHSFYQDASRPTGANNLLVPNTAMPNIVAPYQGNQVLLQTKPKNGILYNDLEWYSYLDLVKQGSMTPEQYDATINDLVNFLAYAAEPYKQDQHRIGWWVLCFLAVLFVFMYALKTEYWKDVKKHKKE